MSSACDTLSPSPPILMRPIPTSSADEYLGLESHHADRSSRSSHIEISDLERGGGHTSNLESDEIRSANETPHLPSERQRMNLKPKLLSRSKIPKMITSNSE